MAISLNLSAAFGGIGRALSHRDYRRFWAGNAISTIGRWMFRMSVAWLTWELTGSTTWLGIVAFSEIFPTVVFSIVAGAIADRMGFFLVMRVCQFGMVVSGALFSGLVLSGLITIEIVVALAFLYGTLEALSTPARMAAVHSMVPQRDLSPAIALGSTTFNAARFIGPATAGLLIFSLGIGLLMAVCALAFLLFFVVLLFIHVDETGRDRKFSLELIDDMVQGVRYILVQPGIRFVMILLGVTGLLIRPFMELLPGFSDQVFGRGPDGMAILLSSIGAGAMISGLWLAQRGDTKGFTRFVTASLVIQAVLLILFTLTGHIWIAAAFLTVVGFAMLMGGIASQTLIQTTVDSSMRARVLSLFVVISWGLPALGALAMGWLASFFGLQTTVAAGAVLVLVFWLWARREGEKLAPELERSGSGAA